MKPIVALFKFSIKASVSTSDVWRLSEYAKEVNRYESPFSPHKKLIKTVTNGSFEQIIYWYFWIKG